MTLSLSSRLRPEAQPSSWKEVLSSRRAFAVLVSRFGRLLLAVLCLLGSSLACFAQDTVLPAHPGNPLEQAAHFIVQPYVTIGLLVTGCFLLFHDLLTPLTWGVTGTLGVICMVLVFGAFMIVGNRGWVGEVLLLAGLAAILLEVHVFPGFGSAIIGFVLMFAGMFLCLGGTREPAFALSITSFLIAVSGLAFLAYLPKSPAWKKMRLQIQHQTLLHQSHLMGGNTFLTSLTDEARDAVYTTIIAGQTGRTLTALRPIGDAEFNGVRVSVLTEGDFLEAGTPIVVTDVDGARIVVAGVSSIITNRV
jgi:membrane-bound serine protease (ClpP class)